MNISNSLNTLNWAEEYLVFNVFLARHWYIALSLSSTYLIVNMLSWIIYRAIDCGGKLATIKGSPFLYHS